MADLTTIRLAGRRLPLNIRTWTMEDRLAVGVTLNGLVTILLVATILAFIVIPGWIPIVLAIVAGLVVAFHGVVDFVGFRNAPAAATVPAPPPLPVVTLRCAECSTVFDLEDPGFRPLHHVCPGCGTHGVLEGEKPTPDEEPATFDYSAPAPVPPVPSPSAPAAPPVREVPPPPPAIEPPAADAHARFRPPSATPPPSPPRKFKHTCKGCSNVAILPDTGERPFVHTCAQCGRQARLALKD